MLNGVRRCILYVLGPGNVYAGDIAEVALPERAVIFDCGTTFARSILFSFLTLTGVCTLLMSKVIGLQFSRFFSPGWPMAPNRYMTTVNAHKLPD